MDEQETLALRQLEHKFREFVREAAQQIRFLNDRIDGLEHGIRVQSMNSADGEKASREYYARRWEEFRAKFRDRANARLEDLTK